MLTVPQTNVLVALWDLKIRNRAQWVGLNDLAASTDMTKPAVTKVLASLRKIVPGDKEAYVITKAYHPYDEKPRRGKPQSAYYLNHTRLVTSRLTARVMLAYLELSSESGEIRIRHVDIAARLAGEHSLLTEEHMRQIVMWASRRETAYLRASKLHGAYYPTRRIECERHYLERLAEFVSELGHGFPPLRDKSARGTTEPKR